jgi:hypothetical protein
MSDVKKKNKKKTKQPAAVESAEVAQKDESPASIVNVAEGEKKDVEASADAATDAAEKVKHDPSSKRCAF